MDWKGFISSLVSDVAWPVVVVVIVVLFRDPLRQLIKNTKHFKGFGIDAEFNEQAQSAAIEAERILIKEASAAGEASVTGRAVGKVEDAPIISNKPAGFGVAGESWARKLRSIAKTSPRSVVTEAWTQIEEELARLTKTQGQKSNPVSMLRTLITSEVIEPPVSGVIQDLRSMRNEVAHNSDLDPGEDGALAYLDASINVVTVLRTISPTST